VTHEIVVKLFNEETGQHWDMKFRGRLADIKVEAFDAQVRAQDDGFFLVSARVRPLEESR
jgi:hypothetical protein